MNLAGPLTFAAALSLCGRARAEEEPKFRFSGDVQTATSVEGAALAGPALRFRWGIELARQPKTDTTVSDVVVGSWGGVEVSSGLFVGRVGPDRFGALATFGARAWLSRWQSYWLLETQRFSVLGALLPEAGVVLGVERVPRAYLGWDLPLGGQDFQIAPGVVWISPGQRVPALFTLALRVPM